MSVYAATILNAILLILLSGWAYLSTQNSFTALIPAIFGMVLLCLAPGLRSARKLNTYLVLSLTVLIVIALLRPLSTTITAGNPLGILRTGAMIVSSLITLVIYLKHMIGQR